MTAAVFRADASTAIGGGHIVRCLALAGRLRHEGWETAFACSPETSAAMPMLARSGHAVLEVADDDAGRLARRWPDGRDWLVVDHYGRDRDFETACRAWARRIMAIDDVPGRVHDCDILLDQNLGREEDAYRQAVPAGCRLLTGTGFALLRPEFRRLRARALARRRERAGRIENIVVSTGASDPKGVTIRALEGIARTGLRLGVNVVLGASSADVETVSGMMAAGRLRGTVHVDTPDMAELMAAADLAIGAGGSTSWERCCLGLPSIIVTVAENQRFIAEQLANAGAGVAAAADAPADDFAAAVTELAKDPDRVRRMGEAAQGICDGQGTDRVHAEMERMAA